ARRPLGSRLQRRHFVVCCPYAVWAHLRKDPLPRKAVRWHRFQLSESRREAPLQRLRVRGVRGWDELRDLRHKPDILADATYCPWPRPSFIFIRGSDRGLSGERHGFGPLVALL